VGRRESIVLDLVGSSGPR